MPATLIRGARAAGLAGREDGAPLDVLIGADGRIAAAGPGVEAPAAVETVEAGGAFLSPGWADLHTHVYWGATDISVRTRQCGLAHGVTTVVDAGSAGEANFAGFREYVAESVPERVYAFLNIGSIGLVACNRVSELIDMRSIDIGRTLAVIEANRDLVRGVKCRASHMITGAWGITPVKLAKKVARIAGLPLMVHIGEPPPLVEEILEVLTPGDIITHCFHGKPGASLLEDEALFRLAERMAGEGVLLDIGHGGASFSFEVARAGIARGLMPFSISTDLHDRSIRGPVFDLATTMSKLLAVGMPFGPVVAAVTEAPRRAIGVEAGDFLAPGREADLTLFTLDDVRVTVSDSSRGTLALDRLFTPRRTFLGTQSVAAARLFSPEGAA